MTAKKSARKLNAKKLTSKKPASNRFTFLAGDRLAPLIRERAAVLGVSEADWIRGCIADRLGVNDLPEFKQGNPNLIPGKPKPQIVDPSKIEQVNSPLDIFRF